MNALDLLINEHQNHRELLGLITKKDSYFREFRKELIHHVDMEEAVFYPGLLKIPEVELLVREAWEEHNLCMQLLQEMDDENVTEKMWLSKFAVLKKLHLTHIDDEEASLFPRIRNLASDELLESLGALMEIEKKLTPTEEILYPEEPGSHKLQS